MGEYSTITFEVGDDHVATHHPQPARALNSFNETMAGEIVDVWSIVRDTDDIHAVVLRADGERAFCTGIDVTEGVLVVPPQHLEPGPTPASCSGRRRHKCWKPVVAAVHGMCAGGGQYFVNEADIIICSDDATFFDPHASRGSSSALEPIGLLNRNVPLGDVLRWALLGQRGTDHRGDGAAPRYRHRDRAAEPTSGAGATSRGARSPPDDPTRSRAPSAPSGSRST